MVSHGVLITQACILKRLSRGWASVNTVAATSEKSELGLTLKVTVGSGDVIQWRALAEHE